MAAAVQLELEAEIVAAWLTVLLPTEPLVPVEVELLELVEEPVVVPEFPVVGFVVELFPVAFGVLVFEFVVVDDPGLLEPLPIVFPITVIIVKASTATTKPMIA